MSSFFSIFFPLNSACIVPLLTGLTKNKVLLAIDLSWNNLNGNNFAEALKTVLMKNKVLEEINVEFNK